MPIHDCKSLLPLKIETERLVLRPPMRADVAYSDAVLPWIDDR